MNLGLLSRARHALQLCFPDQAEGYFTECFQLQPRSNQLYAIRNAINHGEIDADNPIELLRVEERHRRLWLIVFGMLGMLLPIDRPIEPG